MVVVAGEGRGPGGEGEEMASIALASKLNHSSVFTQTQSHLHTLGPFISLFVMW